MLAPGLAQASDSSGGGRSTSCTRQEKQDWNQKDWQHKHGSTGCAESKQHGRDAKNQQNHSNWSSTHGG
jgi:hypothetical protein